jgi:pimeloyl-ACP methyl ester carboxylesterase
MFKPFPQPTGPYQIGTTALPMVDPLRKEMYADRDQQRTLMARLWYPTVKRNAPLYPYLGTAMPAFQQLVAQFYGIPLWFSKWLLRGITTHAHADVECSPTTQGWPVVLFSHGLLGMPSETHISIIESIASAGYIVIGIEHPYFNVLTQYPDGRIVTSHQLNEQFSKMRPQQQREFQTAAIQTYNADMACVLNHLAILNNDSASPWSHKLNLQQVIIMGHSAGGTAAIEFCRAHPECKGAIDLDGWYDHCIGDAPLKQPLLLISGSKIDTVVEPTPEYLARKELTREQYYANEAAIVRHKRRLCQPPGCSLIELSNVDHTEFGDLILRKWPLRAWNAPDAYKTLAIINEHIVNFLKANLQVG